MKNQPIGIHQPSHKNQSKPNLALRRSHQCVDLLTLKDLHLLPKTPDLNPKSPKMQSYQFTSTQNQKRQTQFTPNLTTLTPTVQSAYKNTQQPLTKVLTQTTTKRESPHSGRIHKEVFQGVSDRIHKEIFQGVS